MKVGIYCRLSEEDRNKQSKEDDSLSIQNQKAMLLEYAVKQGWAIYDIYNDDDYRGSDRERPEFKRMLADAKAKKLQIILCKSQARFTREMELVEKYINGLFAEWGVRYVSITDNADTDIEGNKKARQINGLTNEWYLEDMSKNIKSALTIRRVQGFHIGAFALYGYLKDPETKGHLIIDGEAAAVVRKVFNLYDEGYGKTAIAKILNAEGLPNPTEYKRLKGIRKKTSHNPTARLWKYYAISDMLRNEIYAGHMVQGKYGSISYKSDKNKPKPKDKWIRVENTHEPIIEADLWNRVQQKLDENYKPFSTDGKVGLFAKKVRCMTCGYFMRSSKTRNDHYLKCTTNHASKDACIGAFISVKLLESVVLKELNNLILQYLDVDYIEQSIDLKDSRETRMEQLQKDLDDCEKKRAEYSSGIKMLYADKLRGLLTEEDFIELSKDFQDNRSNLDKLMEEKQKALEKLNSRKMDLLGKRQKIEKYAHLTSLTRDVVEELIDYISVGKKDPETGERKIEINWNF